MPWSKKQQDVAQSCWLWTKCRQHKGYGVVRHRGALKLAHRAIYEMFVGPIPNGLELDHLCRQRGCVNPAHLRPVTHFENIHAVGAKTLNARFSAKTQCPQGHPYDERNTLHSKAGARVCRSCKRIRKAEWRRKYAMVA